MSDAIQCSVVIPVYRCEKYLAQAIESVLCQTVSQIEVLIVDDCSPDKSREVARRYEDLDSRVRYIRHDKNRGVAAARNTGVQQARGEWVAFLDAADLWMPNKLEKQFEAVKEPGKVLCCTGAWFFKDDGSGADRLVKVPQSVSARRLRFGNVIITSSVLVKRDVMRQFPMERSDLQEDYIAWLRILERYGDAVGVCEPLVRYRILEGSKSYNKMRSAACTWKTYRFMGWNRLSCLGYYLSYIVHGMRRYW